MLESRATPELLGAQRRALALTWTARGAWDSALVAAQQYAAAVEGAAPLQHMLRLTVTGEWLGALPNGSADSWRTELVPHEEKMDLPARAELAWLDGVRAAARELPDTLAAARRRLRALGSGRPASEARPILSRPAANAGELSDAVVRMLDGSLVAFELALRGDPLRAGNWLADLERQRAEYHWTQSAGRLHPYLTGINRLAAARWLRESGKSADAERLLTWIEAVEFPSYLVMEATALLSARAYYERALTAEALGRTELAREHYVQFLRRYDSPMPAQRALVQRAQRLVAESEAQDGA
jgi:hypothetical protein